MNNWVLDRLYRRFGRLDQIFINKNTTSLPTIPCTCKENDGSDHDFNTSSLL